MATKCRDSSKSQRLTSRVWEKTVDTFILSDVNAQKSNPNTQMDDLPMSMGTRSPLKNQHQSIKGGKMSNLQSVMSILAYIMQCITL